MKKLYQLIALFFLLPIACAGDADQNVARQFLDQYYVMANQAESAKLTEGMASDFLKNEIDLLKSLPQQVEADAYRSRDITFKIEREQVSEDEAIYLYRLKIIVPNYGTQEKMVNITINRKTHKVKAFHTL